MYQFSVRFHYKNMPMEQIVGAYSASNAAEIIQNMFPGASISFTRQLSF